MTDQELLPTARNIPDNGERKADRNRRGIEALMTRLETELGQERPQKKGESLEKFFASNKLQRKRREPITDYITRFEEGINTLQGNEMNLLTIDDVPGWMLMRKASLTQERRERLIAALPDEHFGINHVKHVLVKLFPELHINEHPHRESDGHTRRPRNDHTGSSSAYQRREQTSCARRYRSALGTGHEWADTDSVDDETDVNSADLQGFVRSELENSLSLLRRWRLKQEIDETREAVRYKFGDGGTLVSSTRVTAPVFSAGNCFQRGSFETLALVDWSRFLHSCTSCCGFGRANAQDWNGC